MKKASVVINHKIFHPSKHRASTVSSPLNAVPKMCSTFPFAKKINLSPNVYFLLFFVVWHLMDKARKNLNRSQSSIFFRSSSRSTFFGPGSKTLTGTRSILDLGSEKFGGHGFDSVLLLSFLFAMLLESWHWLTE